MSELLPCPFCGGEAEIERYTIKPYVACMKCGCSMPDRHQTAEQAIAAWNSRADYHGYEQAAIEAWESVKAWNSRAERTCEFKPFRGPISDTDEEGDRKGVCSECSAYMHEQFNYCPNCGARRVGE